MRIIAIILIAIALPGVLYAASVFSAGERRVGVIETIHGIPYPHDEAATLVEEKLAHVDVFLQEPVFGKKLTVTVSFDPGNTQVIDIGVREGAFWLGYAKTQLYRKGIDQKGFQTKHIVFPLTAMFQDTDRSIDIMFFADRDTVSWSMYALRATAAPTMPSRSEIISYIHAVLSRERAL